MRCLLPSTNMTLFCWFYNLASKTFHSRRTFLVLRCKYIYRTETHLRYEALSSLLLIVCCSASARRLLLRRKAARKDGGSEMSGEEDEATEEGNRKMLPATRPFVSFQGKPVRIGVWYHISLCLAGACANCRTVGK